MKEKRWFHAIIVTVTIFSLIVLQNSCFAQEDGDDVVIVAGKYRKIHSKINDKDVTFFEHLPEGYEKSNKSYPVVYLVSSDEQSCTKVSSLLNYGIIPKMILIGISNSGRPGDFFPIYPRTNNPGKAHIFLKFITEELIPYVNQNYRTENFRILYGGSNAGGFTLYVMLANPATFNAYIASSPSLGWCPELYKEMAETLFTKEKHLKKFLYIPYGKYDIKYLVNDHIPSLVKILESQAPKSLIWKVRLYENGGHCPFISLHDGLIALFPDFMISDELKAEGLEAVDKHYRKLTTKYGFTIEPTRGDLFSMAIRRKRAKKLEESIAIFKVLLERYPCYEREYFWLGETYRENGDINAAKKCYHKTLEINPNHNGAKQKLELLNKQE